jgi:hypothetical protein
MLSSDWLIFSGLWGSSAVEQIGSTIGRRRRKFWMKFSGRVSTTIGFDPPAATAQVSTHLGCGWQMLKKRYRPDFGLLYCERIRAKF